MGILKALEILLIVVGIIYMCGGFNRFRKLKTVEDFDKRADELFIKKKWNDVIRISQEMLDMFQLDKNKSMTLYISIGNCHYMQSQFEQAADNYIKAISLLKELETNNTIKNVESLINALDSLIKCNRSNVAKEVYVQLLNYKYSNKELKKLKQFAVLHDMVE